MFLIVLSIFSLLTTGYILLATNNHFQGKHAKRVWLFFLVASFLWELSTILYVYIYFQPAYGKATLLSNIAMAGFVALNISKLVLIGFLLLNDTLRLTLWPIKSVKNKRVVPLDSRRKFITNMGLLTAAVPFSGLIYGAIAGKYDYKVWQHKLVFGSLPESFKGLRIAQISDVHIGSFDDPLAVRNGLLKLMSYQPDLILFTGDLVNNLAIEADEYVELFKEVLQAPFGKYAVLGNHDYGEYVQWPNEEEKVRNQREIQNRYRQMGFELLNNTHTTISNENDSIALVGVENWGSGRFPKYGDYDQAVKGIDPEVFTIVMSHDPDHWEYKIKDHSKKAHLTLSGHTHGSQMGIEIPGWIKWSPVKYRYRRWAGLYQEEDQLLYVNRGFGFIGYPGRIGIWPEITILDLA